MQQDPRLALMGVHSWHARFELPNAVNLTVESVEPAANTCTQPTFDLIGDQEKAAPESQQKAEPAPVERQPATVDTVVEQPLETSKSTDVKPAAQGTPVQFELMIYQSEKLMLIDSQPTKNDPARREFAQKLAVNVLTSQQSEAVVPSTTQIRWPLFEHPNAPKDKEAARAYINNKLDLLFNQQTPELIICAGKQAEEYCLGAGLQPGQKQDQDGRRYLVSYSLGQLLSSGEMKSDFYSHITEAKP